MIVSVGVLVYLLFVCIVVTTINGIVLVVIV